MKFTKGILVSFVVLAVMFVASTASAYTYMGTLKMGSTGSQVMELQKALNAKGFVVSTSGAGSPGMESTYFGSKTKAAVMAFQSANGLTSDGVVGSMTGAKLASESSVGGSGGSTGGALCPNGNTIASNCMTPPSGSGPLCPNGNPISNNCMPVGSQTGPLMGGAGDAIINETSADVETEAKQGESNTRVHGFRVEADGSDIQVTSLKVTLENQDSGGSSRINRYASEVSVWMGNTKVGSANVDSFNKNGTEYSKSISLSGAVVKDGSANRATFHVAVSALSNIDSTDLNNNDWLVTVNSIRFQDATGAIMTDTYSEDSNFSFTSLANSGDVKLKVSTGSNNPEAGNVEVSTTGTTSNVTLLEFRLKAEGTDITFDSLPVTVTGTGATPAQIADELVLMKGSTRLADITSLGSNGTKTFDLDDEYTVKKDSTDTFKIVAKIKKIDNDSFDQGDSLTVSLTSGNASNINAEDVNGDSITPTGSATGEEQTFYSEGISVSDFSAVATPSMNQDGKIVKQSFAVSFKVKAFGNTFYLPKTVVRDSSSSAGLLYTVEKSDGTTTAAASNIIAAAASSLNSSATTVSSYFEIPDGETRTFTTTIELSQGSSMASGDTGFFRIQLGAVRYDDDQSGTPSSHSLTPAQNYESADKKIDYVAP